ncbi:type II toxin-antitoxin system RelE/ParE family toxin [Pseudaminobacter soli (ex Li et al. 2025)]|uniref:Plasmid stabilization protein n=1 Tax=Pseudaminobacter soli (ex Li et al. 2025) TaxID=1295366 RepID=A0A2P7S773_9HYPH|nr:type II toxin-antitoxin system RelE/ParE family toxin [Mesorhizobium soli]PSJ58297.1 plasmid stabilization protein [Mesorhizobium soli]
MRVIFTDAAEMELEAIGDYVALESPARALGLVRELRERCLGLSDMPKRFPLLQRYRTSGIRRRVHGNYLIFYRVENDAVQIIHILHGAMDYDGLLFPEG